MITGASKIGWAAAEALAAEGARLILCQKRKSFKKTPAQLEPSHFWF